MVCLHCGKELRFIDEKKLDFIRYKKYKCDNCKMITELEINNKNQILRTNHYKVKF